MVHSSHRGLTFRPNGTHFPTRARRYLESRQRSNRRQQHHSISLMLPLCPIGGSLQCPFLFCAGFPPWFWGKILSPPSFYFLLPRHQEPVRAVGSSESDRAEGRKNCFDLGRAPGGGDRFIAQPSGLSQSRAPVAPCAGSERYRGG